MPYITEKSRELYDPEIKMLVEKLTNFGANEAPAVGHVNYVFSAILWDIFRKNGASYTLGNNLMGVLGCVQAEFYRRMLAPYEDTKIQENGDI